MFKDIPKVPTIRRNMQKLIQNSEPSKLDFWIENWHKMCKRIKSSSHFLARLCKFKVIGLSVVGHISLDLH